jgi:Ca2+/H+ antiporter
MSRRWRAGLLSLVLAPLLAVAIFVGLAFVTTHFGWSVFLALVVAGAVAAIGARAAGYGAEEPETGKLVGWTIGALLTSFLAIVVAVVIAIIVIAETCDGCFD